MEMLLHKNNLSNKSKEIKVLDDIGFRHYYDLSNKSKEIK